MSRGFVRDDSNIATRFFRYCIVLVGKSTKCTGNYENVYDQIGMRGWGTGIREFQNIFRLWIYLNKISQGKVVSLGSGENFIFELFEYFFNYCTRWPSFLLENAFVIFWSNFCWSEYFSQRTEKGSEWWNRVAETYYKFWLYFVLFFWFFAEKAQRWPRSQPQIGGDIERRRMEMDKVERRCGWRYCQST